MKFDSIIKAKMTTKEEEARIPFKEVVTNFLGNVKDTNYELIVAKIGSKIWSVTNE